MFRLLSFLLLVLPAFFSYGMDCPLLAPGCVGINPFTGDPPGGLPSINTVSKDLSNTENKVVSVPVNGGWTATGLNVVSGNSMNLRVDASRLQVFPKKYFVVYRLDYRFAKQAAIIYSEHAYSSGKVSYVADYSSYSPSEGDKSLDLSIPFTDTDTQSINNRASLLNSYFAMINRGINVSQGDVVNVLIAQSAVPILNQPPSSLYDLTTSGHFLLQNQIVNISSSDFCSNNVGLCSGGRYNTSNILDIATSSMSSLTFAGISSCLGASNSYCYHELGSGMQISIGDYCMKNENEQFAAVTTSDFSNLQNATTNYVYTFVAPSSGLLTFSSPSIISREAISGFSLPLSSSSSAASSVGVNNFQSGGYMMELSVGKSSAQDALSKIRYEYLIQPDAQVPDSSASGQPISGGNVNASNSGFLWFRASSDDAVGVVKITGTSYVGKKLLSTVIESYIVKPVIMAYQAMAKTIYKGLTVGSMRNDVFIAATLYILLYAIYFLLGAIKVTASDLLIRIIKIIIVVSILFSDDSWNFFNTYLFNMLFNGANQLISIFTLTASDATNPFGFLDPIFDRYTALDFWVAIIVQLCQFWTGMGFLALLTIAGVTIFMAALLEVVMTYVICFILISILIGLAPLFIPMILFSYTAEFFKNWLTMLFKAMIQPAILIFLILMFDDFMNSIIQSTVLSSQWGCLAGLDIKFNVAGLEVNLMKTSDKFCLPFYIPSVGDDNISQGISNYGHNYLNLAIASFMYFTYSLIIWQLIGVTNSILGRITGVSFDNAVVSTVRAIKHSTVGRAFEKGNKMINEKISKRAPILSQLYTDPIGKRLQNSANLLGEALPTQSFSHAAMGVVSYGKSSFYSGRASAEYKKAEKSEQISKGSGQPLFQKADEYKEISKFHRDEAKSHWQKAGIGKKK